MDQSPVSIYHAANSAEAHLICDLLQSEGIEAQISGENQAYAGLATAMPVEVLVPLQMRDRALAVLAAHQQKLPETSAEEPGTLTEESVTGEAEIAAPPRLSLREHWLEAMVVLAMLAYFYLGVVSQWLWPDRLTGDFWSTEWNVASLSIDLPILFMTLFLMQQSGTSWTKFGLVRPKPLVDVPLAFCFWMMEMVLWLFFASMLDPEAWPEQEASPEPGGVWMHTFSVVVIVLGAFMEELLLRAYLITRLEQLFRSSFAGVFVSAALFAGYHLYQGWPGLLSAGIMGLLFGGMFCLVRRVWPITLAHTMTNLLVYWQMQVS